MLYAFCLLLKLYTSTVLPAPEGQWKSVKYKHYTVHYQSPDRNFRKQYASFFKKGHAAVKNFFSVDFQSNFDIYLHPERASMDRQWQADWKMPDFKSECWMVASGIATKLDLLSPRQWASSACEHHWADQTASQRLITHEMVHVFHGQRNASPDFSDVDRIDWFVEGLATYASGQCDSTRLSEVKKAVAAGKIPAGLDQFWTGKLKYGLSGSVVLYLDQRFGRAKLLEWLPLNKKEALLSAIGLSETTLLEDWKNFMLTKV